MKTLDPIWVDLNMEMHKLCNDNVHYPLKMEVYDWDKHSEHDIM